MDPVKARDGRVNKLGEGLYPCTFFFLSIDQDALLDDGPQIAYKPMVINLKKEGPRFSYAVPRDTQTREACSKRIM